MAHLELRWDDWKVFLFAARCKTLTATAVALGVHTSTAHRRLTALEAAVGARLFERSPAGLVLTDVGLAVLPQAQQLEEDIDALMRNVQGHDQTPGGTVHLTAPEPLLPLLVDSLSAFRRQYPAIDLHVTFADRFFDLSRREADVALRPSMHPPEDVIGRPIAAVAWAVYVAQSSSNNTARPWASYGEAMARLTAVQWWHEHHGGESVLLSVNSVSAMQRVIACSPCRGLLPCFVGDPDPNLMRLSDPIPAPESRLWLLIHPDLRRAARVRVLREHLWQALRSQRAWFTGQ